MADDRCKTQGECPHAGQCEIEGQCIRVEGSRLLQVAVAPDAAAGPYPTARRPATSQDLIGRAQAVTVPADKLAELQREAARYRWLRSRRDVTLITMFFGNGCVNKTIEMAEARIDAEIAAAGVTGAQQSKENDRG